MDSGLFLVIYFLVGLSFLIATINMFINISTIRKHAQAQTRLLTLTALQQGIDPAEIKDIVSQFGYQI